MPAASVLLGAVASAIFLTRLLPQPVRLVRTGAVAGVSPLAALAAVVSACAWLAYGLSADLLPVWAVSVAALVPGVWTVVLLRREVRWSDAWWSLGMVAVLVAAASAHVFGAALGAGVLATAGPQVWRAVREHDLSGIAPTTWWVAVLDGLSWGAYGVVVGDAALEGYCVVLVASAAVILGRLRWVAMPAATHAATGESAGQRLARPSG